MRSISASCLFVLALFAFLHIGTSYECYSCVGADTDKPIEIPFPGLTITSGCANPIDTDKVHARRQCSGNEESCLKIETSLKDTEVVIRSCLPNAVCEQYEKCYKCDSDLCNSSSSVEPWITFVSIMTFAFAKLFL